MKISYITESFAGCKGNGITSQAITWASIINQKHPNTITLINPWEPYDFGKNNIIHIFGSSNTWFFNTANRLKNLGCKIIWSPICDNIDNPQLQRIKTKIGCESLQLFSLPYIRKKMFDLTDFVSVRSHYEKNYLKEAYKIPENKFLLMPVSMSYDDNFTSIPPKDPFCLHISSIYQDRKNVIRLIKAAQKYDFPLVLAGNKGSEKDFDKIKKTIGGCSQIKVLGFISEEEKISLYKKAKIFALPSIKEGVGIVAVDAAHYGCDIVITNIGGSKEYFGSFAEKVSPFSIDSIGSAIKTLLTKTNQPSLKNFVDTNFSRTAILKKLLETYNSLL